MNDQFLTFNCRNDIAFIMSSLYYHCIIVMSSIHKQYVINHSCNQIYCLECIIIYFEYLTTPLHYFTAPNFLPTISWNDRTFFPYVRTVEFLDLMVFNWRISSACFSGLPSILDGSRTIGPTVERKARKIK